MKKADKTAVAEMRAEYDFASMKGGVRGKYLRRIRSGSNLVLLEPDMAEAFPTDAAVDQALRAVLNVASVVSGSKRLPKKARRPPVRHATGLAGKRKSGAASRARR